MALIVDELDKKIEVEAKNIAEEVKKTVETALVKELDGRTFGCWGGWSVRIFRTPKSQTPPKTEETAKVDDTSATHSAPVSV